MPSGVDVKVAQKLQEIKKIDKTMLFFYGCTEDAHKETANFSVFGVGLIV